MTISKNITPKEFRHLCKDGTITTNSSGFAPGYAQANILILPKEVAADFELLCARNPVPCPLLGKTLGSSTNVDNKEILNDDKFDLRTDLPKYYIFKNGNFTMQKQDVLKEWDLEQHVGFFIGCSFSFENALCQAGLTPSNIQQNKNVSMYQTSRYLNPAGIFTGVTYVVSMRPYKVEDIEKVRDVTRPFMKTHGEPIDWGYDALERLGIKDLKNPEYGDAIFIADDEVPVFWGCGVTTQAAALQVSNKFSGKFMSHAPGHMLILDIKDVEINV